MRAKPLHRRVFMQQRRVVARIVTGPHDANRQDHLHLPMRYDTGRPSSVIRLRISQPRMTSLPCPAGLRARRPSPMMDLYPRAYGAGISRKNEILGLTWEEIDEAGGVIRLSPARSKTLVGRILPYLTTLCRPHRATAGTPRPRQPARLPPRRHPRPALAHGVAHRLPGGRRADPLPPRLPAHRRPQSDPRQRPRARRHAPDRPQDPRHLRPLQHHQRTGTAGTCPRTAPRLA